MTCKVDGLALLCVDWLGLYWVGFDLLIVFIGLTGFASIGLDLTG